MPMQIDESVAAELREDDEQYIERNEDGSATLALDVKLKVKRGKELVELEELQFRPPVARDWMDTDKASGDLTKLGRLVAALTDIPFKYLEEMDGGDFLRACRLAGDMGNRPKTGGTL